MVGTDSGTDGSVTGAVVVGGVVVVDELGAVVVVVPDDVDGTVIDGTVPSGVEMGGVSTCGWFSVCWPPGGVTPDGDGEVGVAGEVGDDDGAAARADPADPLEPLVAASAGWGPTNGDPLWVPAATSGPVAAAG
ncbi:MAG TPA: hypothetical protein VFP61_11680, partial [Acidimicrobiales bacterium]|nr:hypothetical protein [Acidimicrobiales bacterium]